MSTTIRANAFVPVLEPAAESFVEATAKHPFIFELPPAEGRKLLDDLQSGRIAEPEIDEEWVTVEGGPTGKVEARIVKPRHATGTLPVVLYIHGAGWVFGDAKTHDRLVRELAVGVGAAVVFPEYSRSPEAKYPVAIEQNYAVAQWIGREGGSKGLDASRIAVAGDSVGGNLAAAATSTSSRSCSSTLSPTPTSTLARTSSSPRAITCVATACSGSGTSTRPTRASGTRLPPHRFEPASTNSPACRRRS
jgi:acetyl esterase/lipase